MSAVGKAPVPPSSEPSMTRGAEATMQDADAGGPPVPPPNTNAYPTPPMTVGAVRPQFSAKPSVQPTPLSRKRFRFKTNDNVAVIGPPKSGKTHFILKCFIDGFEAPLGTKPFDKVIYLGNEGQFDLFRTATATMCFTYLNVSQAPYPIELDLYLKSDIKTLEGSLKPEAHLRKLVIFDDVIKDKIRGQSNSVVSMAGENQHTNSAIWTVLHQTSDINNGKSVRDMSQIWVFINETDEGVRTALKRTIDDPIIRNYSNKTARDRVLIYDKNNRAFFDKNLDLIQL